MSHSVWPSLKVKCCTYQVQHLEVTLTLNRSQSSRRAHRANIQRVVRQTRPQRPPPQLHLQTGISAPHRHDLMAEVSGATSSDPGCGGAVVQTGTTSVCGQCHTRLVPLGPETWICHDTEHLTPTCLFPFWRAS